MDDDAKNYNRDLASELQKIYDSKINVRISWSWRDHITLRLADEMKGVLAEESFHTVSEIVPWLQEAIAHFYPTSSYALSLSPQIRERAAAHVFYVPQIGSQVICPNCGAPNVPNEVTAQMFAFVCARCRSSVEVWRPPALEALGSRMRREAQGDWLRNLGLARSKT